MAADYSCISWIVDGGLSAAWTFMPINTPILPILPILHVSYGAMEKIFSFFLINGGSFILVPKYVYIEILN